MAELFIKEVINGNLIEIDRINIGIMLKVSLECKDVSEHEKIAYMMCAVTKVNGEKLNPKEFLESNDFAVFNFVSESFNAMTNNNIF
jgi:hypothetical protein